jgi:hypothetical protein
MRDKLMNYVVRLSTSPAACRSIQTLARQTIYLCLREEQLTGFIESDSQVPCEVEATQNVVGGKMLKQVMKITLLYIPKSVRL